MMNAVVSSGVYLRVRDKLESVTHIIALDSACQFAEKGEEALKLGLLPNAKDLYSQAFKLNPEFLHLHTILVGIDKTGAIFFIYVYLSIRKRIYVFE